MAIVDDDIWTDSLCSEMCAALVALTRYDWYLEWIPYHLYILTD